MKLLFFILFNFFWAVALTLEQAVEIAVKNHSSLKLSTLELQKAEEGIRKARAGILPQVGLSYSYTRLSDDLAFGFTPKNRHSYSLEVEQAVFNRAVFEGIKLAKEQRELQEFLRQDTLREVEFQTKALFYALLYRKEVIRLLEENLKYWEENLRQTEGRFQAGMVPKVELVRAKAQLENVKAQLEGARADYRKSLEDLRAFLQLEERVEPQGSLTYTQPISVDREALLRNNSTLKVAKKNLEVAQRAVSVQESQYYPTLNFFANYQGNTARVGGQVELVEGYTFGARLSYRIFDGFAREASLSQARIEVLKQAENLKDTENKIRAEFLKTLEETRSLQAQIRALELSLEWAKESFRLSTERYRFGVATQLEVLEVVSNYNQILQNYYLALFQYNTALARLERLTK
ncbi:MAG: TolC family protein [Aquificaceae bacterium]|nr:TolC family protein [Aquificaceae bacterium]